jgi:hypothetical protein
MAATSLFSRATSRRTRNSSIPGRLLKGGAPPPPPPVGANALALPCPEDEEGEQGGEHEHHSGLRGALSRKLREAREQRALEESYIHMREMQASHKLKAPGVSSMPPSRQPSGNSFNMREVA